MEWSSQDVPFLLPTRPVVEIQFPNSGVGKIPFFFLPFPLPSPLFHSPPPIPRLNVCRCIKKGALFFFLSPHSIAIAAFTPLSPCLRGGRNSPGRAEQKR